MISQQLAIEAIIDICLMSSHQSTSSVSICVILSSGPLIAGSPTIPVIPTGGAMEGASPGAVPIMPTIPGMPPMSLPAGISPLPPGKFICQVSL